MIKTYTLNETGKERIMAWVERLGNEKVAKVRESKTAQDEWFSQAEDEADRYLADQGSFSMEMGMQYSADKNPHTIRLDEDDFDCTVISAEQ